MLKKKAYAPLKVLLVPLNEDLSISEDIKAVSCLIINYS